MTTHVLNTNNDLRGTLVRLDYGEPVVRYFGDHTEYLPGWRHVLVTRSDEFLLPPGRFDDELHTDPNGDVWRRTATSDWDSPWPCETDDEDPMGIRDHLFNGKGTRCWNCHQVADRELTHEVFTLVAAEGFPAQSARPQTRAEIEEWTAGPLLAVGSPEARARAQTAKASAPTPGGGCPMALAVYGLVLLVVVVVVLAVVHAVA
jgi:hypothetical protein